MQVFFIQKCSNVNILKRTLKKLEFNEDRIILNCKCEKYTIKKKKKIVNNIRKILTKNNSNKVILSNELKQDIDFTNLLYSNNLDIIDGKILFKLLISKILKNICKKNDLKSEEKQIGITVNQVDSFAINLIEELSRDFKTLNVVTNNINYLKKIKEKLWTEDGIIITVTNNKKKALLRADIILNIDFPEELINMYNICDNTIIVNLEESIKIKKKRFNGRIINEYNIKLRPETKICSELIKEDYKDFDLRDLAEIYIMNNPEEIDDVVIT